jgi:hypothetical protein
MKSGDDDTLFNLLMLHGEIFPMDNGYWTKFEAYLVEPSMQIPQGVRYSLTLHDKYNTRVLGFDNAHGFKPKKRKYGAHKITWDHQHRRNVTIPYEYESALQLLEDFWLEVEMILAQEKR